MKYYKVIEVWCCLLDRHNFMNLTHFQSRKSRLFFFSIFPKIHIKSESKLMKKGALNKKYGFVF